MCAQEISLNESIRVCIPQVNLCTRNKSQRIYTSMHSAGLELTKLTYTRLEDNLIRHRGDRQVLTGGDKQE